MATGSKNLGLAGGLPLFLLPETYFPLWLESISGGKGGPQGEKKLYFFF